MSPDAKRIEYAICTLDYVNALAYLRGCLRYFENRPLHGFDEMRTKHYLETRISDLVAWRMTTDDL